MKKILSTLGIVFCMSIASQAMASSIVLDPASTTVSAGDTTSVGVRFASLGDPMEDLYSFNLDFGFDSNALNFVSLDWNPDISSLLLGNGVTPPTDTKGAAGHVTFDGGALGGLFGDFTLATLNFTAVADGATLFGLGGEVDTYSYGADPLGSQDKILRYSVTANGDLARIPDPAPVPEPASMLLLGTGLVGLVGARRRKSHLQKAA